MKEHIWPDAPPLNTYHRQVAPLSATALPHERCLWEPREHLTAGLDGLLEHISDLDRYRLHLAVQTIENIIECDMDGSTPGYSRTFRRLMRSIQSRPLRYWCMNELEARLRQVEIPDLTRRSGL